jgi:hypothetical protein
MKAYITMAALAAGLAIPATTAAMAASPSYCAQVAQNAVNTYTHPAGSAAVGCGVGAALGAILTRGNGGAAIGGCVAGGATGLVISDAKRKQIYDAAYYDCMSNGGPPPRPAYAQPVVAGPPPSSTAMVTVQLNVRVNPDPNAPVLGVLPQYSTVSVGPCTPGWCTVNTSGGQGWASRKFLSFR